MTETATEAGTRSETIDQAIVWVENLYRSVTGRDAPAASDRAYANIPPEKAPEQHVEEQIDRLIDALGQFSGRPSPTRSWTPPLAVWESSGEYLVRVDLPGISRQTVKITAAPGAIEISGRRTLPQGDLKTQRLCYVESLHGEFRRLLAVPQDADVDRLQAQMKEGVLEIKVPRNARPSETKTVAVG
jgi:HSP20 family protein